MPKDMDATVKTEAQKAENQPIFLVELELDSGTKYFTDSEIDINFPALGGNTYVSWGFDFSIVKNNHTGEIERVTFAFDNTDLVFRGYLDAEEFQGKRLKLKRVFENLLTSSSYATTIFFGDISSPIINQERVSFVVYSPTHKYKRQIPKRKYQPNCQWKFDSIECLGGGIYVGVDNITFNAAGFPDYINVQGIDFAALGFSVGMELRVVDSTDNDGIYTITGISPSGQSIYVIEGDLTTEIFSSATLYTTLIDETAGTADSSSTDILLKASALSQDTNYWQYGFVEMTSGSNNGEKRYIISSTSGNINFNFPFTNAISAGNTFTIKRGCLKSSYACKYIFDNFENFGGFSTLPQGLMGG